jgi:TldD protein
MRLARHGAALVALGMRLGAPPVVAAPAAAPASPADPAGSPAGSPAAPAADPEPPVRNAAEASTAEVDAVAAELSRAINGLRLPGAPAPYRAEARWVRADLLSLDGSYGGVITNVLQRQTAGLVELRVGSLQRDNSNFFTENSGIARFAVSLEPAPEYVKKQLWLALDQAFRGASLAFTQKKTALERLQVADLPDDFGPPPPAGKHPAPPPSEAIDRGALAAMVGALSARFEAFPAVDNGDVHLQVLRSHETIVTTEGLRLQRTRERAVLAVVADTRAPDGMHLDHGLAIHLQGTPQADDELLERGEALVDQVLRELQELADAPLIEEEYDGPILVMPTAAAQFLASTVATEASGQPAPWSETGRVMDLEPAWQGKLGDSVLPPFIDMVDDPTEGFGKYAIDAEGFAAPRLVLVEQGRLVNLLMTRTPNPKLSGSNGRARMTPGLEVGASISNLRLESRRRGMSKVALERELLRRAAEDGYEFAYTIELLRDGSLLGGVPRESAEAYAGTGKLNLPLPGRVFRIEPGGKRTLVRGAVLAPASVRVLRRIRAVGDTPVTVPMRLAVGSFGGFAAEVGMDGVLSQTVDAQITTPALLVDGLELLVERGEHERQRTLVHPLRERPEPPATPDEKAPAAPDAPTRVPAPSGSAEEPPQE